MYNIDFVNSTDFKVKICQTIFLILSGLLLLNTGYIKSDQRGWKKMELKKYTSTRLTSKKITNTKKIFTKLVFYVHKHFNTFAHILLTYMALCWKNSKNDGHISYFILAIKN